MSDSPEEIPLVKEEVPIKVSQGIIYGIGCGIGGSIFILLGTGIETAGPGILISLILGGILIFLTALNYSELTTSLPLSGGAYNFSKEGLGGFLAFIIGFFLWIANTAMISFSAQAFAIVIEVLFVKAGYTFMTPYILPIAIAAVLFMSILVYRSERLAIKILIYSTFLLLAIFAFFIISGLFIAPLTNTTYHNPSYIKSGASAIGVIQMFALLFIFFTSITSNLAYLNVNIDHPSKNVPKVNILAILLTLGIYLAITYIVLLNVGDGTGDIIKSPVLLAEVLYNILGPFGFILMGIAAIISTLIAMNAALGSAVSVLSALSRDKYVPEKIQEINRETGVPIRALIITLSVAIFFTLITNIGFVAEMTVFIYFFGLAFINYAAVRLRYKRRELDRPFKVPFFPFLPIFVAIMCLILAMFLHISAIIVGIIIALFGVIYYLLTIADRHSIVITLAGLKLLAVILLGFLIWLVANFGILSSAMPGFEVVFRDVLLRILIYICILGLGTVVLDVIPLREIIYFVIRKTDKEKVAILGQIIEMDKADVKTIHFINVIISYVQLISSIFIFFILILLGLNIVTIESVTLGNLIMSQEAAFYFFTIGLIFLGIVLFFGAISMLYLNRELKGLGI